MTYDIQTKSVIWFLKLFNYFILSLNFWTKCSISNIFQFNMKYFLDIILAEIHRYNLWWVFSNFKRLKWCFTSFQLWEKWLVIELHALTTFCSSINASYSFEWKTCNKWKDEVLLQYSPLRIFQTFQQMLLFNSHFCSQKVKNKYMCIYPYVVWHYNYP